MRLVSKTTGQKIAEGDRIETKRVAGHISGIDAKRRKIWLYSDNEAQAPRIIAPAEIGAEWAT